MRLFVKIHAKSTTLMLDVEASDSILCMKEKIQEQEGSAPQRQRLMYSGSAQGRNAHGLKQLADDRTIASYGIEDGSTITLSAERCRADVQASDVLTGLPSPSLDPRRAGTMRSTCPWGPEDGAAGETAEQHAASISVLQREDPHALSFADTKATYAETQRIKATKCTKVSGAGAAAAMDWSGVGAGHASFG